MAQVSDIPTVLVVDGSADNIALISSLLRGSYRTRIATDGEKALRIVLSEAPPDLVLLDVEMPGMDVYEVCRQLKEDPLAAHLPVIFLAGTQSADDEEMGLRAGAVDYIAKPVSSPVLLARVETHLALSRARRILQSRNSGLEDEVRRRTEEIEIAHDTTILVVAMLAETRDNDTGNHIRRTQHYVRILAEHMKGNLRCPELLDEAWIDLLCKSVPLHDIGKVGIPDAVLRKPGRLTAEEFEIMKTHAVLGRDAILAAESQVGTSNSFLYLAREVAGSHHEKWNGSGYPEGLSGDDIPLSARLMSVADVYDALISRRDYKPAFSHDRAVVLIVEGKGRDFDPDVVDAFLACGDRFAAIARQFLGDLEVV